MPELNPIRIYDSHYRGICTSERGEQIGAMDWVKLHHPDRAPLVFHVPNESKGKVQHQVIRKRQGVLKGVVDIVDVGGTDIWRCGIFEMKRLDSEQCSISKEQKKFMAAAAEKGCFVAVCYGRDQFILAYLDFLSLSPLQSP